MKEELINTFLGKLKKLNEEQETKIRTILNKLYEHQIESLIQVYNTKKGIVVLPTGVGKTFLEAAIIAIDIILNKNKHKLYVVNAPRIILSYQLLLEFYKFLIEFNLESRFMCVHSGNDLDETQLEDIRKDSTIPYSEINATTSHEQITNMIEISKFQNLPLIIFSTYHSADKIESAKPIDSKIDILLNDEAHYLVQNNFHDLLNVLTCERNYFFTATTKNTESDLGFGMNNVESFGEILYQMVPRKAIELGFMIRPRIHFIKTDSKLTIDNFNKNIGQVIHETYKQHQYVLDGINPKMLISAKGVDNLIQFRHSEEYKKLIAKGIDIFMVTSNDEIGNMINGQNYSRLDFLNKLKEYGKNPEKRFIVIHFDIISEGVDISGFTGVFILRTLGKSKFLQTYGRIARLHLVDKENLSLGKMQVHELDRYLKPYGWIIIPSILSEDEDNKKYLCNLINELRDYGFKPNEDIKFTETDPASIRELEGPDALMQIKIKSKTVYDAIQKLEAEYEDEKLASLTTIEEKLDFMGELFKK